MVVQGFTPPFFAAFASASSCAWVEASHSGRSSDSGAGSDTDGSRRWAIALDSRSRPSVSSSRKIRVSWSRGMLRFVDIVFRFSTMGDCAIMKKPTNLAFAIGSMDWGMFFG